MPAYSAFCVKNGQIVGAATDIAADNDQAAIEQAKQLVDGCDIDLWEGGRFVIALRASDKG
jgi:hypothetical protein